MAKYSDDFKSDCVLYFERHLFSCEARLYRDRVKYALTQTLNYYQNLGVTWATVTKWFIVARHDTASSLHQHYKVKKESDHRIGVPTSAAT